MAAGSRNVRSLAVVTDSTADLTCAQATEWGVDVVPLSVTFGAETFPDGEMSQAEFFRLMNAAPQLPTTSQPPIGAFIAAYERALEHAEEVVSVHISSKLSGTFEGALQAAEQFAGRVRVFDSRNLSWGLGWQVRVAAEAARDGLSAAATLERLHVARQRCKLIVGLDNLSNLAKGGRIGRVGALLGSLLDLKVTFTVDSEGAFAPLARSRGEKAAMRHTLEWVAEQMGAHTLGRIAVGHALSPERAQWLRDQIAARWSAAELVVYEAGTVIATHTGTGWGVAVLPED